MKKLITFLLVSFLVTTKLFSVPIASGATASDIQTAITVAKATSTDIVLQFAKGGTWGTPLSEITIAIPAGVTKLTLTYDPATLGAMPVLNINTFTYSDALMTDGIVFDGVKLITASASKYLVNSLSSTNFPGSVTIQNCWIEGFKGVFVLGTYTNTVSKVTFTNDTFKSIGGNGIISTGFTTLPATNTVNNISITNNTFIDCDLASTYLIDHRSASPESTTFNFSNNTIFLSAAQGNPLFRIASSPTTAGHYTFNNNIFTGGTAVAFKFGSANYANISGTGNYYTQNFTGTPSNLGTSTGVTITQYDVAPTSLFNSPSTYDFTIKDASFPRKSSCGDPRWYYSLTVTPSVTTLSGFSYNVGSGPSTSQPFTVSAVALRTAITLTAPADYEISTDNSAFLGSLSIGTAGSDLSATTVYVRLKAGLAFAAYNNETITIATSGTTNQTISCSGNVLSGRTVLGTPDGLSLSGITNSGFTASWNTVANASSYTVKLFQSDGVTEIGAKTQTGIAAGTTSTSFTGLSSGTTYQYSVIAVGNGVGFDNSSPSGPTSVTTKSSTKSITVFTIGGQSSSSINGTNIAVVMPFGSTITSLTPSITHTGVSISPTGVQDFTSPIQYTVTAEDASTQIYTVTVSLGSTATDYFRTKTTGNWNNNTTWQSSPNSGTDWYDATIYPDGNAVSTSVLHDVTYAGSPATVGNVSVSSGVILTNTTTAIAVAASKTLTIASGATLDNQIDNATFSAGSGAIQINGTYKVSAYTGTSQLAFSGVTFASGSTLYIGCPGAPRLPATNGGNVVWASAAGGSFLNTIPTTTIAGNLTITSALANALNNGSGNTVRALTIAGDLTINGGVYNPQGGSGTGTQTVAVNGNVYLSGSGKLYAVNPLATGLGTVSINGNIYIQSPTDVALSAGGATGTISLSGSSLQTISADVASGYTIDGLTIANATGVNIISNLTASNIINNASSFLSVAAGKQLTVNTTLTNNGTLNLLSTSADGTATIITPASITTGIAGTYTVQQYLTTGRNWYISSPVSEATSNVFNALNSSINKLYWYDETNGSSATFNWPQITDNSTSLAVTKGYVANVDPSLFTPTNTVTFTGGTLNTGDITTGVNSVPALTRTSNQAYAGYNLVGNPYPSYLDWVAVSAATTNIDPTMWYRTKNGSVYEFDTYNATSGVGTTNATVVTQFIPPMQAFWVSVSAGQTTGTLALTNSMRCHQDVSTNMFRAPAAKNTVQQILRLKVSNGTNSDEAIVLFNPNASNGYDAYDSPKRTNANAAIPEIYTTAGTEKLVINGMNSIPYDTELPLGFTTGQSNAFSIKATEISNLDTSTKVYLKDNLMNILQDMTDGTPYTFASDVASTTSRFSVVFKSVGVTTGVQATSGNQIVLIYKNANNQITVNCNGSISDDAYVSIYNALGQKLESKHMTSSTTVIGRTFTSGVYVVTVNNGGKTATQKVILN